MVKFKEINLNKKSIIDDLTNKNINDWLNILGFNLDSNIEREININGCIILIINKTLKLKKMKGLKDIYYFDLLNERNELLKINSLFSNKFRLINTDELDKYKRDYEKKIKELENQINNKIEIIDKLEKKINDLNDEIQKEKNLKIKLNEKIIEINNNLIEQEKKFENLMKKLKNDEQTKYSEKDFINLKEISKGGCGTLFSAENIKDNSKVCLKKFDINFLKNLDKMNNFPEDNCLKDLENEIQILKLLSSNENSVKYFGNYDIIKEKVIIMEKCDENLEQFINKRKKELTIPEIKKIFIDLNKVFRILNQNNIIHRDLKMSNFLVKYIDKENKKFIVKLSDYGIGKFLKNTNNSFSGIKGTQETMAPEILLSKIQKYEKIIDIFSLGIVLYQLSHNLNHPFNDNYLLKYAVNYEKDNYIVNFDENIKDKDFKDLVSKMLKLNPKNRLTWEEYFEHPFFK